MRKPLLYRNQRAALLHCDLIGLVGHRPIPPGPSAGGFLPVCDHEVVSLAMIPRSDRVDVPKQYPVLGDAV